MGLAMNRSRLQGELKKRGPFASLEQEAMLNILRCNDQFQNRFGRLFRQYGMTASQYNVLRILRGEGKPLPCLEIAERMIQVVPAITGLIDRLEAAELVVRHRCEADRRIVYIDLTEKAKQLLAEMDRPVSDLHQQLLGHMSQEDLHQLISLLEKSRLSLASDTADHPASGS